ncbi:MAG: DnaA regulatory inactivator Hda [Exilibacterium sp.]
METAPQQLSLGVSLNDDATFRNFYTVVGSNNAHIVDALRQQAGGEGEKFIYLWGGSGTGLTHLLQAACHEAEAHGLAIQYLPLCDLVGFAPDALLEGFEALDLICLDGLHQVASNPGWELALFDLFNRVRDYGKCLLVAADASPRALSIRLPDLKSRLTWGVVYQVDAMRDSDKQAAIQLRARARGLELSDEVAHFILHRAPRNMNELFNLLNRLDDASLAEQRRLTIPFVKRVLNL